MVLSKYLCTVYMIYCANILFPKGQSSLSGGICYRYLLPFNLLLPEDQGFHLDHDFGIVLLV